MPASAVHSRYQRAALLLPLLVASHGFAQDGVGERARPALLRVGVAGPARAGALALAGTVSGGVTEALDASDKAHARVAAAAAAAINVTRWLDLGAHLEGRYDRHTADGDDGLLFQPELSTRLGSRFGAVGLGLEAVAWLPGGPDVGTSASALSADGRLLVSAHTTKLVVASQLGYRLDRSAQAAGEPARLRFGDRSALGVSDFDAALLGLGVSYTTGKTLLFAEASADLLLGGPSLPESPLRLGLGLRQPFGNMGLSAEASLQVALSERPALDATAPLVPIEPRALLCVGIRYEVGHRPVKVAPAARPAARVATPSEAPPPLQPSSVTVALLDDQGQPLRSATVTLLQGEQQTPLVETEPGHYLLEHPESGRAEIRIEAPGFKPVQRQIEIGKGGAPLRLDVKAEQALPPGQVRGLVRSFNGKALAATVRVEPLGAETHTDADGFFQVDVPPGEYEVVIEAPGYGPQRRKAKVEQQGVVIVNADLSKAQ